MLWPARTIWDTRIQCVCGILTAQGESGPEIYVTATFAEVSSSPPRVAINPNRLYPIESIIRKAGRFAINVMPASARGLVINVLRLRRREPHKARVLQVQTQTDHHQIPFLPGALRTVFCEVQQVLDTGDHSLIIGRVLESRLNPRVSSQGVLFYPDVSGRPSRFPGASRLMRIALNNAGLKNLFLLARSRLRPAPPPDLARNTYLSGGQSDAEISQILTHRAMDQGRTTFPPPPPAVMRKRMGVCVVGTGWGTFHCELVRRANPDAELYVSGRNRERTERLARSIGAQGAFIGYEAAVADPRVQALILAVPFELHRPVAEEAARAGKHVLVEKPITTTLQDADAMIAVARESGTILMVAEDMHFRPVLREAVRRISLGHIGEPLYLLAHAGGKRGPASGGSNAAQGILMDMGVHYVHALRLLMGEPDEVYGSRAMQVNTKMQGEDSAQLLLSSKYGWEAHILLSWASVRGNVPDLVLLGDSGTLHLWPGKGYLDHYPAEPRTLARMLSYVRPRWLQRKLTHPNLQRVRIKLVGQEGTGYLDEVREFLAAVGEARAPSFLPEDARRDLEIVLACYQALELKSRVPVPAASGEYGSGS